MLQEILVDGLVAIASGEHPRLIESRLLGYISDQQPAGAGS
jgi:chemotaxis protein MotA